MFADDVFYIVMAGLVPAILTPHLQERRRFPAQGPGMTRIFRYSDATTGTR